MALALEVKITRTSSGDLPQKLQRVMPEVSHGSMWADRLPSAPARVQHHPQDAIDAGPGMPEAGVSVGHFPFGARGVLLSYCGLNP